MASVKSSSGLQDGSVSKDMSANSGLSPELADDTLTFILSASSSGIAETLQEAFQRITQAQPQAAIPNTSPKSSTGTTPQSSGGNASPANPVEGQVEYMVSGPMGTGWYVYTNGQWVVDTGEYFYGSPTIPHAWGRCECGAEKSGQPGHSSWCPKFEGK